MKPIETNPHIERVRAAYRLSNHFRSRNREPGEDDEPINGGAPQAQAAAGAELTAAPIIPTASVSASKIVCHAPAAPFGIPWDELEREFSDRAET